MKVKELKLLIIHPIPAGSLWEPNISFDGTAHGSLAVRFSPHVLSKEYLVIMKCGSITENLSVKTVRPNLMPITDFIREPLPNVYMNEWE